MEAAKPGRVGRFFLGLLAGAAVAAVLAIGGALAAVALAGRPPASRILTVAGADLSLKGGREVVLANGDMKLSLACRGRCDDLRIGAGRGMPRVKVMDAAGDCLLCGRDARWVSQGPGVAALATPAGRP